MKLFIYFLIFNSLFATDWQKQTIKDLEKTYMYIYQNHPGILLEDNFLQKMNIEYLESLDKGLQAKTIEEYYSILNYFTKNFDDSHLQIIFPHKKKTINSLESTFAYKYLLENVYLVTLPTFSLNEKHQKDFKSCSNFLSKIHPDQTIIFDLRGNTGGNSFYAEELLKVTFGEKYFQEQYMLYQKDINIYWRASAGNLSYFECLKKETAHENSDFQNWINEICEGLKKSFIESKDFFIEKCVKKNHQTNKSNLSTKKKIFCSIDKGCASATLDFIDMLTAMNCHLVLVGQETNKDSQYMEVREENLSDFAKIVFPIKAYVNRPRKNNESYKPHIICDAQNENICLEKIFEYLTNFTEKKITDLN